MNATVSNTLFHFTRDIATLQAILSSSQFLFRLNRRDWRMKNDGGTHHVLMYEIPMTCFTETPVQFISNHTRTFGDYGIGMKIGWAIQNGAQNVIYCEHDDPNDFGEALIEIIQHDSDLKRAKSAVQFSRPIMDSLVGATEQMRYRDEREWRFIGRLTNTAPKTFTPTAVNFALADISELVCPKADASALKTYIDGLWGAAHGIPIRTL